MSLEFLTFTPLLWLLLALPALGLAYARSLVDRPPARKAAAFACRVLAVVLLALALCRPFLSHPSRDLHATFLLDASESIDPAEMRRSLAEINRARQALPAGDSSSLFLFADSLRPTSPEQAEAFISDCEAGRGEAAFRSSTRLASALSSARLAFPAEKSRRIVVFSDGILDDPAADMIRQLRQEKTDLHFARLQAPDRPEAAVLALESTTRSAFQGEQVRFRIRMAANRAMPATLRITHRGVVVASQEITLAASGETTAHADIRMDSAGDTVWEAELIPQDDWFPANNRAALTLPVRGKPRILLLHARPQLVRPLERMLRTQDIEIETRGERGLPEDFESILAFDAILLADVPATAFSARQMSMLKRYVSDFGGGLAMFGSENSFGLGGYHQTPVEEVLPLVSRFEKDKEKPSLAMVLVIDKSGSMSGNPIQLARQAALGAADLLGPQDQIAIIGFDSEPSVLCELTPAANRATVNAAIESLEAGGGTDLAPAMARAFEILRAAPARLRHVIAMTDGETPPANLVELSTEMAAAGMTVSTVAMGSDASAALLEQMAAAGRGRFYHTDAPENVPQIFTRETMQASRSAIKEDIHNAIPVAEHPLLSGFERSELPPVLGYVMTRPKPTSQVILAVDSGDPLLAVSRHGLGTTMAFTADLTERWGGEWLAWDAGGRFWAQALRAILRKDDPLGIETSLRQETNSLLIDVLRHDDAGRPLNQVAWNATAFDDQGREAPVRLLETGIGRYRASLPTTTADRLTIRLHDPADARVKTLRWSRPSPSEYQLAATPDPALSSATPFTPETIRSQLIPAAVRTSLLPHFTLAALLALLTGATLRRI